MAGWQDDPIIDAPKAKWQNDPLVEDAEDDVGILRHGQSSFMKGLNTIQDITPLSALLNSAATGVDLVNWGREKITGNPVESSLSEDIRNLTPTQQSARAMQRLGVTTDVQPDTDAERFVSTAARIAGSAVPFAAAGPVVPGLLAAVGAGLGGASAEAMFPDSAMAPVIGALAGGMAPGAVSGAATGVRNLMRGSSSADDVAQAIDDFTSVTGMTPSAATATGSRPLGVLEGIQRRFPGGGHLKNRRASIGDATARAVDDITPSASTPNDVGAGIVSGVEGFVKRTAERGGKLYDKIDDFIAPTRRVPITNTMNILDDVSRPVPGAEKLSAELAESGAIRLLEAAKQDAASGGITFQALNRLRSEIGRKLSSKNLVDDISTGTYKRIYGAISDDIQAAANRAGPEAVKAFNRANNFWGKSQNFIKGRLNPIAKKAEPEQVYQWLVSGSKQGVTRLKSVRAAVPKDVWDDMAHTYARRLGMSSPGAQNASTSAFSIDTFLTNWNKIPAEARNVLFGGKASAMHSNLKRIARMADKLKTVDRYLPNPGGTAETGVTQGLAGALVWSILGGNFAAAGKVGLGVAANAGVARLMTNPGFVNWLAKGTAMPINNGPAYAASLFELAKKEEDPETRSAMEQLGGIFVDALRGQ